MSSTEERLRDALLRTAESVDERRPRPLPVIEERRRALLVPLLAAASMLVVLVASLAVAERLRGDPQTPQGAAPMPRYYVTSAPDGIGVSQVKVRESATGKVSATYRSEGPEAFLSVTAAADARRFFVLTQERDFTTGCQAIWIYRLSINDAGKIVGFAKVEQSLWEGRVAPRTVPVAATADGRNIAYAVQDCDGGGYGVVTTDLNSGAMAAWSDPSDGVIRGLSWTADGRALAVFRQVRSDKGKDPHGEVRLLTGDNGQTLTRDRVVLKESASLPHLWNAVISPDGQRVIAVVRGPRKGPRSQTVSVVETSVADGRVLRTLYITGRRPAYRMPSRPSELFNSSITLKRDASGEHLLVGAGELMRVQGGAGHRLPDLQVNGDAAW